MPVLCENTTNLTLFILCIYLFILQAAGSDSRQTGCHVVQHTIVSYIVNISQCSVEGGVYDIPVGSKSKDTHC